MLDVFPKLNPYYSPLYSTTTEYSVFSYILGLVSSINQLLLLSTPGDTIGPCNGNLAEGQTNEQPVSQSMGIQPRARPSYSGLTNNIPDPSISDRLP